MDDDAPREPGRDWLLALIAQAYPSAQVVSAFPVLWFGWETDNWAAIVEDRKRTWALTTDHGSLVEVDDDFLDDRLNAYSAALEKTVQAKKLLHSREAMERLRERYPPPSAEVMEMVRRRLLGEEQPS